jgi:Fe-S cluster assembly protein SufD
MSSLTAETDLTPEAELLESHKKFMKDKSSSNFTSLNKVGAQQFEKLGYPSSKHEMFTFVNIKSVAAGFVSATGTEVNKDQIAEFVYSGCEQSLVVLVDGQYQENLSDLSDLDNGVKLVSGEEALADSKIREYLESSVQEENDTFAAINAAFCQDGLFLDIPAKVVMQSTIQILAISSGANGENESSYPRVLVRIGDLSEAKIIVRCAGIKGNYFVNSVQDFLVGNGAGLGLVQVETDQKGARNFSKTRLILNRDSRFNGANVSYGSALTRCNLEARLKATGSEFRFNSVGVLEKKEQVHHYMRVYHEAAQCSSDMHFKNIVNDQSRSSVDGTVIVEQDAQLTNSDQLINNLLLSNEAHADSKPNLIINADDVKCTHGNTVGQIDEEQLFYLKARGLSEAIAKTLLTKSFAASIVETIEFPSVRKNIEETLLKKLEANDG